MIEADQAGFDADDESDGARIGPLEYHELDESDWGGGGDGAQSESDEVGGGGDGAGAQGGAPAHVTAVATASASGATPSGGAPGKRRRVVTLARWEPSAFVRMLTAVDVSTHT